MQFFETFVCEEFHSNHQSCINCDTWGTQHILRTYPDQVQVVSVANEGILEVTYQTFPLLKKWFPRNQKLPVKKQGVLQRHCQRVSRKMTKGREILASNEQ